MSRPAKHGKREAPRKLPLEHMPQISNVVSATECTGIVAHQPANEAELESDMELFSNSLPPVWPDPTDRDQEEKED